MNTPQQRPFPQALCDRGPVQHDRHHHRVVRLFLYGIAAALIFNKIYFPAIDPITGTLAAFGTYAVGFVARRWAASCSVISATASAASPC